MNDAARRRAEPITMQYLPPDEHVPNVEGIDTSGREVILSAFKATRGDVQFFAGWGIMDEKGNFSAVGNAVLGRVASACDAAFGSKPELLLIQVSKEEGAWERVRGILAIAKHGSCVFFGCHNSRLIDAAFDHADRSVQLVGVEGELIPHLNKKQVKAIKRRVREGRKRPSNREH